MKFKNNTIEGEVFVVATDMLDAIAQVDAGCILTEEGAAHAADWNTSVYRVMVSISKA